MAEQTTISRPAPYLEAAGQTLLDLTTKLTGQPVDTTKFAPTIAGQNVLTQAAQQQAATQAGLGTLQFDPTTGAVSGVGTGTGVAGYQPFLQQAAAYSGPQAYQQFMSPYQQEVIDTSLAEFDKQRQIAQQQIKGVRSLKKDIVSQTKKLFKYEQKKASQKKTNQNKGPQKLIPIYTKEMEQFFKDFHMLKDKNEQVIYEKIESDSEHVLGSREIALKLITAYIKKEGLQDTEDKKRINMDTRLKELLPKLVAAKDGEDNCYFHTLMGAIADHFKA